MKKIKRVIYFFLLCFSAQLSSKSLSEQLYRQAERLEKRLLFTNAIVQYEKVLKLPNRFWKRRAAYRIGLIIRQQHFSNGRSEQIRPLLVALYKNLLSDLPSYKHDPELWQELRSELPWIRLGLQKPLLFF